MEHSISMRKELRRVVRKQFGGGTAAHGLLDSGYRAMWTIVCFDLPVGSKAERRAATRFRQFLLRQGFTMKQWSVYHRYHPTRGQAEAAAERVGVNVPSLGSVSIYFITDKQYGLTRNYEGAYQATTERKPDQLTLL